MRLRGVPNAWAIGDCAAITNAYDGKMSPPTGQFAERQGRQAAENIVRLLRGEPTRPFRFRPIGQLCSIGGHNAVAELLGFRMSGFFAWFVWRSVYLFKLPTWSRRVEVAFNWAWEWVFSRDLMYLKTDQSKRVSTAYYQPGDYIFRTGEPGTSFYVIEHGEVEAVTDASGDDPGEVIAVLGKGDFFGEQALIAQQPRGFSVRARTPVEVVVLGKHVFSQISSALAPLNQAFAAAIKRRTNVWERLPLAHYLLDREPLAAFVEPLPVEPLTSDATLAQAVTLFEAKHLDSCCVVDERRSLLGVLTRSDLVRSIELLAAAPDPASRRDLRVRTVMGADPVAITLRDSTITAAFTLRDHALSQLPVVAGADDRRLVGIVRVERIMKFIFDQVKVLGAPVTSDPAQSRSSA